MKVFSKEGLELMEVKSVVQQGDILIAKGKAMGSMPVTIAIKPQDCWELVKLIGFAQILRMPVLLIKGYFLARKAASAAAKQA